MADDLIGKVINGYEVLSLVGQGGMARVYLATQQSMGRQVALKVLPQQFLHDDTYLQRFNREVKIASQLEHAHIIPVYDYGETEGQPFIAMRYMPSGSVDDRLSKGALDPKTILHIISQVAPALDYAHSKGVLHRDLKPSNVLLDESGDAYLTDFGIARLNEGQGIAITTHGVVGTPSYMSPEQAQGKELDGRSDIYSLGVMLFELATGRRPFENDTPYSIAVMQVTTQPPFPRKLNPRISESLERVILKSLRKDPNDRYQSGQELTQALKQAVEHPEMMDETDHKISASYIKQQVTSYQPPVQAIQPTPQNVVSPLYAQPPVAPSYSSVPPSGGYSNWVSPVSQVPKRKRSESPMMSVLMGGGIGCVLIMGMLALIVWLVLPALAPDAPITTLTENSVLVGETATLADAISSTLRPDNSTATATLDATSESARATLLARQQGNDATMTALAPTMTATPNGGVGGSSDGFVTPSVAPSGLREREPLVDALAGASGNLIYADQRGDTPNAYQIIKLNLKTWVETELTIDNANNSFPIASPDGRWIAFQSDRDGDLEIYVVNTVGGQLQRITRNDYADRMPSWSADGEWVIYSADVRRDGMYDLLRTRLGGTQTETILSDNLRHSHARYSPDGRYIAYTVGTDPNDAATWEIEILDTQSGDKQRLTNNNTRDAFPNWSPDGEQLVYVTYEGDTKNAIALINRDGTDARIIYADDRNNWAASFSPDGQLLVITQTDGVSDNLLLITRDGKTAQQITFNGGMYASWIGNG
jgi:serine/threonine protein kinase/Tol biopolymer transport system component